MSVKSIPIFQPTLCLRPATKLMDAFKLLLAEREAT
jgi:hypothetical protein